jgi:hypothetical protein
VPHVFKNISRVLSPAIPLDKPANNRTRNGVACHGGWYEGDAHQHELNVTIHWFVSNDQNYLIPIKNVVFVATVRVGILNPWQTIEDRIFPGCIGDILGVRVYDLV